MASLFTPAAAPAPAPEPAPAAPTMVATGLTMPLAQAQPAAMPPAAPAGKAKLTLATLLTGHSQDDLGFNPSMVPAWVSTSIEQSILQEQNGPSGCIVNLGTLIDGVADIGFRNMLSGAKRDFRIQLPANEVFHALTASSESMAPASAAVLAAPMESKAPAGPADGMLAGKAMFIQPGNGQANAFAPPASEAPFAPAAVPAPASGFASALAAPEKPATTTISFTPFGSSGGAPASPPPAAAHPGPAAFAAPAPAPQPAPAAAPTSAFAGLTQPLAAPVMPAVAAPSPFPMAPEAPKPAPGVVQPLASGFCAFGASKPDAPATPSKPQQPMVKAFDPFAPSPTAGGLSSDQLLGKAPASGAPAAAGSAFLKGAQPPAKPLIDPFASTAATPPSPAPELPVVPLIDSQPKPSAFFSPAAETPETAPTTMLRPTVAAPFVPAQSEEPAAPKMASLFSPPGGFAAQKPEPQPVSSIIPMTSGIGEAVTALLKPATPAPAPATAPQPAAPASQGKSSFLGLTQLDTATDQLLLRALLGVDENLNASRVVELLATLPGLCACVCLRGSSVLSHANPSVPDAASFPQQAGDIARQLRGLAPLIGIDGAETFTLNARGRLLTFCFPGDVTVGVLHDGEPGNGLRDKITLVSRELARMLG
ncbi:MAG: hypothetical protein JNN17_02075 [Verrucomicrobiaceae bacterium]|nr:hypothetical protein [Verrucomicrobiaceae bacterium]